MKLLDVTIKNFRSIDDLTLDLSDKYYVLIGKNECGKTNLLKAINHLDPEIVLKSSDIREALVDEELINNSSIDFEFRLDDKEIDNLTKEISKVFYNLKENEKIGIKKIGSDVTEYTLKSFIALHCKIIYEVDLYNQSKNWLYYTLAQESSYKLNSQIKRIKKSDSPILIDINNNPIDLNDYDYVNIENVDPIIWEYVEDIKFSELNRYIGVRKVELASKYIPKVIYWEYSPSNLLPSNINLDSFCELPDICLPLKHIFKLAGIQDIKEEITACKNRSSKSLANLLHKVSKLITSFFYEKWPEYDSIQFDLSLNGELIDISIKEQNNYDLEQRSDGFKRFVTFLIMISANVRTDILQDTIILIDEPEIGLHPSGQRFLRKELKEISKKNMVIYSSHSIFMVDPDNLEHHFIVKKKNEITELEEVGPSNIYDEEVAYNALGCSIFESLKKHNIVFEGWKDKKLFKIALNKIPSKYEGLNNLRELGLTHARGVKDIKHIIPIFELANRDCLIISDSDGPAIDKQKEYNKERYPYKWLRYNEIIRDQIITCEDFLKAEIFISKLNHLRKTYKLPEISVKDLEHPKGKLYAISCWLGGSENKIDIKSTIEQLKDEIFTDLKHTHIDENYYKFLVELQPIIFNHNETA